MTRVRGFTLLELMIVVAIVAILAAIAVPTYSRYAIRAHRVDGQGLLMSIANAQERFYATNNHYGALTDLGFTTSVSPKGYYNVSMVPAAASTSQSFTATAAPQGGQTRDDCKSLRVNNAGVKDSTGTTTNGSCW